MKRFSFIALTLLIACVWTIRAAPAGAILDGSPVVNQADTGQVSLYTATDADDFASKLMDMVRDDEETLGALLSVETDAFSDYAASRLLIRASETPKGLENYSLKEMLTDGNGFYVVEFASPENAKNCKDYLDTQSYVKYAEPDRIISLGPVDESGTPLLPNDPLLSWGVSGTKMDVFAALLKEKELSSHIVVAVVDTGADTSHSFLSGRMTDGYNLIENNEPVRDGHGHGTHVSGTIAEATKGLNISIMPVRVLGDDGRGYSSIVGLGIKHAADNGANVINLSLGGGHSDYIDEAIAYAIGKNITVVAAAGNNNDDTENHCPAHIQDGIIVAAVDSSWNRASFSNYGDAVDIAAPGVSIGSCIPGEKYASWSGTSMATPHVSAASALLLYQNPALTPKQIETELRGAAIDCGTTGWDKEYGAGTLSMQKWIPGGTLVREGKFGENDSLTWSQYSDNSLYVSGAGAIPDYGTNESERAPWYDFRAGIRKLVIESGITSIGKYAFWDFADLSELVIADTVKSTSHAAFHKCKGLTAVVIPKGMETLGTSTFDECTALVSVTLDGVKTIENQAFKNCHSLTSFAIPDSVTKLDGGAFGYCENLTALSVGENSSFSVIDGVLFSKDKKTLIAYPGGKGAVYAVPDGTVQIGDRAFYGRTELTDITLPNSVTALGGSSFEACFNLKNIVLPNSLQTIGGSAFNYCALTSVTIPASVTSIGGFTFWACGALKEILVEEDNSTYCSVDGVVFTKDMKTLCFYPAGKPDSVYTVPDGVVFIAGESFATASKITSVIFPEGVTEIGHQAFWGCGKLESVVLPSTLTKIVGWAFAYCNALKDAFYHGSEEQWKAVDIDNAYDWPNRPILEATMHYSQIAVGTAETRPGESVEIPVSLELNPGLTVMRLSVSYNKDILTLENVVDGNVLGSKSHGNDYSVNPYTLYWNNHTAETNFTVNGTIATLKFKVSPDAADGNYPISVSYDSAADDILNKNMRPVSFDIASGGITVTHIRYGDVNDDKSVTPEDSEILDRYLAHWSEYQTINSQNADVNTDTSVTVLDSVILARHLANWKGFETLPYIMQSNASLMEDGSVGTIQVGTSKGAPGDIIPVVISLKDNPGLTMMRLYVAYDSEALELREVKDAGILGAQVHSDNYDRNPYTLFWKNAEKKENYTENGTAVTLLFQIKADAQEGSYPITVSYDADKGDILDSELNPVSFQTIGGNVTVTSTSTPSIAFVDVTVNPDEPNENCVTAIISCSEPGAIVWCGMYNESGQFMGVLSQDIVKGQTDYVFFPHMNFDHVKIFVLDSELRPLCAPMVSK